MSVFSLILSPNTLFLGVLFAGMIALLLIFDYLINHHESFQCLFWALFSVFIAGTILKSELFPSGLIIGSLVLASGLLSVYFFMKRKKTQSYLFVFLSILLGGTAAIYDRFIIEVLPESYFLSHYGLTLFFLVFYNLSILIGLLMGKLLLNQSRKIINLVLHVFSPAVFIVLSGVYYIFFYSESPPHRSLNNQLVLSGLVMLVLFLFVIFVTIHFYFFVKGKMGSKRSAIQLSVIENKIILFWKTGLVLSLILASFLWLHYVIKKASSERDWLEQRLVVDSNG